MDLRTALALPKKHFKDFSGSVQKKLILIKFVEAINYQRKRRNESRLELVYDSTYDLLPSETYKFNILLTSLVAETQPLLIMQKPWK